jgi:hypothetical protein
VYWCWNNFRTKCYPSETEAGFQHEASQMRYRCTNLLAVKIFTDSLQEGILFLHARSLAVTAPCILRKKKSLNGVRCICGLSESCYVIMTITRCITVPVPTSYRTRPSCGCMLVFRGFYFWTVTCTYLDNKQSNNKKSTGDCNILFLVRNASSQSVVPPEVHRSVSVSAFTAIE